MSFFKRPTLGAETKPPELAEDEIFGLQWLCGYFVKISTDKFIKLIKKNSGKSYQLEKQTP